ncbi:MAG: calcium-binding protein, partial [Pseudomonadota bacterium]
MHIYSLISPIELGPLPGWHYFGTDADDTFVGTWGDDVMYGSGGADHFDGRGGNDTVDYSNSDAGVRVSLFYRLQGFGGDAEGDTYASVENITGSNFRDRLTGSAADNIINGGGGNDTVYAREGNDTVDGGDGNDTIYGHAGDDDLTGGDGDDTLYGGDDNDTIDGGNDDDIISGGAGKDTLIGGDGIDTVSYVGSRAVVVDLAKQTVSGGDGDGDTIKGFENAVGGFQDDILIGNDVDNILTAGTGNDTLTGGLGADTFVFSQDDRTSHGKDVITDFEQGADKILFDDMYGFSSFAELEAQGRITEDNGNTIIDTSYFGNGDTIVLEGFSDQLTA